MLSPELALVFATPHPWALLGLASMLAGVLCLDDTAVIQSWLGQPLPAALLTGLLWGRPDLGLAVGFPLQLALIGNLPVGQSFVGDPVTATVAVTAAACRMSLDQVALPMGSGPVDYPLWGWLLLGAGLMSLGGHWVVHAERTAFGLWMHEGRLSLKDGRLRRLENLHLRCLSVTFLRGAVLSVLGVLLVQHVWIPLLPHVGPVIRRGVGILPFLLPGLGIGALCERFHRTRTWFWVVGGAGLALLWKVVGS
ncbi:hypothetical protein COW53_01680 [bacterium CG17_big_fil_post_rev_8_21_14_2_50_64_8]|nr:MAG: hypothetical protein COW53_01680 [bacterium CG17_big_fil_post_rev_8_21_14_2_50_64_8]PJA76172.1 MAG: hypothetical protein CO151_03480 [bacterium CG_4_9_14_3_um_filter_65_15]